MCDFDRLAPCPECGGDGGFEESGSGRWSVCTWCDGTGNVETEAATSERDFDERFADIPDDEEIDPPMRIVNVGDELHQVLKDALTTGERENG